MNKSNLHGWYITYNTYTDKFCAAKSEHKEELASNNASENILKSSNINTLVEIIMKTNGDKKKLKKLVK